MSELTEKEKQDQAAALEVVNKAAEAKAQEVINKAFEGKEYVSKEDAKKEAETLVQKAIEDAKKELQLGIDKASSLAKKASQIERTESGDMNIEKAIKTAIGENGEKLKSFRGGEIGLQLKEITDANFVGDALAHATTSVRPNVYNSPYSPFYLRNIFPNLTTEDGAIVIPQIQGYNGAVAVWERGTGEGGSDVEKPNVEPIIKDITVAPKWLSGTATVRRELLLNVKYLQSTITNTLLYSRVGLFAAENKMITDYLAANAVAYSGTRTVGVEMIKDAAFNQLLGNYLIPTHVLMNQEDYLKFIDFNKANGSGEYDLPNSQLRVLNGSGLEVNLTVVPVPTIAPGTAYIVASNEFEFITRLEPELRVFEQHGSNVTLNKITFRAEEMAAFVTKDLNAAVKIDLTSATNGD